MRGDTYLASATVVSSSGQVRYSTHLFPKRYDIRYNQNDFNPFFNLSRTASETASVITTENRYSTETNASVFLNIYRKVRDSTGLEIGYVAVDVFYETLFNINDRLVFSDLILIDTSNYLANSLINSIYTAILANSPHLSRFMRHSINVQYRKHDDYFISSDCEYLVRYRRNHRYYPLQAKCRAFFHHTRHHRAARYGDCWISLLFLYQDD
jgi:hypothetical protein